MKKIIINLGVTVGIISVLFLPGWFELSSIKKSVEEFSKNANKRGLETRIVRYNKEIVDPFTWWNGKPSLVVARKEIDNNFLFLYAQYKNNSEIMDKGLVSAQCEEKKYRFVSRNNYESFREEIKYDVLGNKLPSWEEASYKDMLSVLISESFTTADRSAFFDIACNWNNFQSTIRK